MLTLKQFRTKYNITQRDLATQVGVTPATLSKYEHGEWLINQTEIDKILELYGVEIRPVKRKRPKKIWMKKGKEDDQKRI